VKTPARITARLSRCRDDDELPLAKCEETICGNYKHVLAVVSDQSIHRPATYREREREGGRGREGERQVRAPAQSGEFFKAITGRPVAISGTRGRCSSSSSSSSSYITSRHELRCIAMPVPIRDIGARKASTRTHPVSDVIKHRSAAPNLI